MSDKQNKGNKGKRKAKSAPAVAPIDKTPVGAKKDVTSQPIPSAYYPSYVEAAWYEWWEKEGLFKPDFKESKDKKAHEDKFVMVIPPPNVTGTLHLGHTLMCAIEDTITRWHRMSGKQTLWLPGTDHAGIATQTVVEKKLMREKKIGRKELGREKFLEEVWKWKEESGSHICKQLRRLGSSCDWTREAFTMDKQLNKAVKEAFVRMYDKGLIYRQARLVNWSCALQTAISEIEVDKIDINKPTFFDVPGYNKKVEFGVIHKFRYTMKDDPSKSIIVATTRIETMLGDVAVAVHSSDPRYKDLIGKEIQHPVIKDRRMIVITDDILVDPKFGTGAVKITPAHDPHDFDCGKRHKLQFINILDTNGNINENGGKYKGMHRFECREKIIAEFKSLGIYEGKETNKMALGFCSRSQDVIEPVIRPQWWVNCDDMARRSVEAVEKKELKIIPEVHIKSWNHFLKNIQPWCISRQLWWGHRIPAYFVTIKDYVPTEEEKKKGFENGYIPGSDADANFWIAARNEENAAKKAHERFKSIDKSRISIAQDEDVLDTWFSSGLFPFSTMGWPDKTPDLEKFFPGHLLETGHDIIFFWVARMVMMSLELMDQLPFDTVFLHAMVRDKLGRKMSKSRGNVVDPISVMEGVTLQQLIDKIQKGNLAKAEHKSAMAAQRKDFPKGIPECGADALRYGLMTYMKQGRSINLDINVVVACRHFCNKLWQATKFALSMFDEGFTPLNEAKTLKSGIPNASLIDKWILSRLHAAVVECDRGFNSWSLAAVADATKAFFLNDFCDNYLEMVKPVRYDKNSTEEAKSAVQQTLYLCISMGLRLLHPLMPFVTEELYQRLPGRDHTPGKCDSIMLAMYPKPTHTNGFASEGVEASVSLALSVVGEARSMRARVGLNPKDKTPLYVKLQAGAVESEPPLSGLATTIVTLTNSSEVKFVEANDSKGVPKECLSSVAGNRSVSLPLKGFVDLGRLCMVYEKKTDQKNDLVNDLKTKMAHPVYATKTPDKIKADHKLKLENFTKEAKAFGAVLANFESMMTLEERKALHEKKIQIEVDAEKKHGDNLKKLQDGIPEKTDKKYKKIMHKLGPKIKKAESQLTRAQAKLAKYRAITIE